VTLRLADIVDELGGRLWGNRELVISGLAPLSRAVTSELAFLSHPKYETELQSSKAACVIVGAAMLEQAQLRGPCIVADDPYLYFARVTQLWKRHLLRSQGDTSPTVHPSAVLDPSAQLHVSVSVGPLCVVERGAVIGAGTVLKAHVTVGENCVIGERCTLHAGVVIGADGFGFAQNKGAWEKIEQLGAVRIGSDVEIGANTCIDRGALQDTVIEDGVKLDNLIQIGHNVHIGQHTAIAGCVGIAGSATIGANCTIGGGAVVLGHLNIGDNVHISAASVVMRSILKPGHYTGIFPIDDNTSWERNAATLKQLHRLRDRVRAIEKTTSKLD
jgi:UDP-3-O-[3-hydroxymyristoyl] glucosamine N-acyltransferase